MISRLQMAGLAVAVLALSHTAVFWQGWRQRGAVEAARVAEIIAERRVQAARIAGLAEALATEQAARVALAVQMEEAARADPDADRPALGPDSVRRLSRR
jgi:anti-sigma factor RsiW